MWKKSQKTFHLGHSFEPFECFLFVSVPGVSKSFSTFNFLLNSLSRRSEGSKFMTKSVYFYTKQIFWLADGTGLVFFETSEMVLDIVKA